MASQRVRQAAGAGAASGAAAGAQAGGPWGAAVGGLLGGISAGRLARPGEDEAAYKRRLRQLEKDALGLRPEEAASLRAKVIDPRLAAIREQQVQANAAGLSANVGAQARQNAVMREEALASVGEGAREIGDIEAQMMRAREQQLLAAGSDLSKMEERRSREFRATTRNMALDGATSVGEAVALDRLQKLKESGAVGDDEDPADPGPANAVDQAAVGIPGVDNRIAGLARNIMEAGKKRREARYTVYTPGRPDVMADFAPTTTKPGPERDAEVRAHRSGNLETSTSEEQNAYARDYWPDIADDFVDTYDRDQRATAVRFMVQAEEF